MVAKKMEYFYVIVFRKSSFWNVYGRLTSSIGSLGRYSITIE